MVTRLAPARYASSATARAASACSGRQRTTTSCPGWTLTPTRTTRRAYFSSRWSNGSDIVLLRPCSIAVARVLVAWADPPDCVPGLWITGGAGRWALVDSGHDRDRRGRRTPRRRAAPARPGRPRRRRAARGPVAGDRGAGGRAPAGPGR